MRDENINVAGRVTFYPGIAIVEAIEETGNALLNEVLKIAKILEHRLGVALRYCILHPLTRTRVNF